MTLKASGDSHRRWRRSREGRFQAAGYVAKPIAIDTLPDEVERICGLPEA